MMIKLLSLLLVGGATRALKSPSAAYVAQLEPLDNGSSMTGTAVVFVVDDTVVGYAGFGTGFEADLGAEECTATNGCGVHIHDGTDCTDKDSQGGHFFESPVTEDPWTDDRYTSDEKGVAKFSGIVDIGSNDVGGRAFLVHAADGSRVACGLLKPAAPDIVESYGLLATSLPDQSVVGFSTVLAGNGIACFYGQAFGLASNLQSFLAEPSPGSDCQATNGCGVHIHSGPSCDTTETQGGHFYNKDALDEDPWALVGYSATDDSGTATFLECVATAQEDFSDTVMIIHESDGSRVACGPLVGAEDDNGTSFETDFDTPDIGDTIAKNDTTTKNNGTDFFVPDFETGDEEEDDFEDPSAAPSGEENTGDPSVAPSGEENTGDPSVAPSGEENTGDPSVAPSEAEITEDPSVAPSEEVVTEDPSVAPSEEEAEDVSTAPSAATEEPAPTSSPVATGGGDTPSVPLEKRVFAASLSPIGDSGVEGTVVVFVADDEKTVGYAGSGTGFAGNLGAEDCTATNGCGVHIHSGFDCSTAELQGGHFFEDPVTEDPWTEDRLTTDESGLASFSGISKIGTDDIVGRVFLLHAPDGSRVACGILEPSLTAPDGLELFWTKTGPLSDSGVTGIVRAVSNVGGSPSKICYFGDASGLEPNLKSHLLATPAGRRNLEKDDLTTDETASDCKATNGCGVHVHEGKFCISNELQGGHLYNKDTLDEDPWALIGYETTDSAGTAYFVGCVETGVEDGFDGRVFIIHANDGSRVSCGPLIAVEKKDEETSSAITTTNYIFSIVQLLVSVAVAVYAM